MEKTNARLFLVQRPSAGEWDARPEDNCRSAEQKQADRRSGGEAKSAGRKINMIPLWGSLRSQIERTDSTISGKSAIIINYLMILRSFMDALVLERSSFKFPSSFFAFSSIFFIQIMGWL